MTEKRDVFNTDLWALRRGRIADKFADYAFLHKRVLHELCDRLYDFTHSFQNVFVIGLRLEEDLHQLETILKNKQSDYQLTICAVDLVEAQMITKWAKNKPHISVTSLSGDILPQVEHNYDLVIHHLHGHVCNDVPGFLIQLQSLMAEDAVYLGSLYGGETLTELRHAFAHAEMELRGGIAPHIAPFATLQDVGGLMQRCHFTLPVIDFETIAVAYRDMRQLMHDLRYMGEANCLIQQERKALRRDVLNLAESYYQEHFPAKEEGRIKASFDVIYMTGRKASSKQQTPLKPGQGDVNLGDVLAAMPAVEQD